MTKSNDQKKQIFINNIRCHFNLRRPNSTQPTIIYCIIYINGKQRYFSTGAKVYPQQWSKKKEITIISNLQTKLDNYNNQLANNKIRLFKERFSEFKSYICNDIKLLNKSDEMLKKYIYKDMVNKNIKGTEILENAFQYYFKYLSKSKVSKSKRTKHDQLKSFFEYVKNKGLSDQPSLLNQHTLNNYQKYLQDQADIIPIGKRGGGIDGINQKCKLIELLINKVISCQNDFLKYKISPISYVNIPNNRKQKDKPRFALSEEEIDAIRNCDNLKDNQKIYRDIFLLQLECGQRVSDLISLLKGNYSKKDEFIVLKTKKENTTSYFPETEYINKFFNKYKEGYGTIKIGDRFESTFNDNIRKIAKKAELNRIIKYKDTQGRDLEKKCYEIIVNHDSRHTFATKMLKMGYTADEVCKMTGHTDDEMIRKVYGHKTDQDEIKTLTDAQDRINGQKVTLTKHSSKSNLSNIIFALDKIRILEKLKKQGVDIFHLPETAQCRTIIKNITHIEKAQKYINQYKGDKTNFNAQIKSIDTIVWQIAKYFADPTLYLIFQNKEEMLGIIDKQQMIQTSPQDSITLEELIIYMWEVDDRENERELL